MNRRQFILFLVFGLFLRILYSSFSFHPGDLESWKYFGKSVFLYGVSPFLWWSQGPFNAIPLIFFQGLNYLGLNNSFILSFTHHIPFIFGDILLCLLTFFVFKKYANDQKYFATLVVWLNPLLIFVSSIKGQSEQYMVLFTLHSFLLFSEYFIFLGFFVLGIAIGVKYLPFLILPFMFFVFRSIKVWIYKVPAFLIAVILGFTFIHLSNIYFYGDYDFLRYFLDRSGTIFGNFVPNFGDIFVGTGSSVWGALRGINLVDVSALSVAKSYWLEIYAVIYSGVFLVFFAFRKHFIPESPKERFLMLNLIYMILVLPFLFLYPQTVDHRFLNFVIPGVFVSILIGLDVSIINVLSILIIFASVIYKKEELFMLSDLSPILGPVLWLILFCANLTLSLNRSNAILSVISLLTVGALLYIGNSDLHFHLFLINYIPLLLFSALLILLYLGNKYVKNRS